MAVRRRERGDRPALEALAREVHRLDGYPKYLPSDLLAFVVDPSALDGWVVEADGRLVGHVALHPRSSQEVMDAVRSGTDLGDGAIAVVARLLVAPSARTGYELAWISVGPAPNFLALSPDGRDATVATKVGCDGADGRR